MYVPLIVAGVIFVAVVALIIVWRIRDQKKEARRWAAKQKDNA